MLRSSSRAIFPLSWYGYRNCLSSPSSVSSLFRMASSPPKMDSADYNNCPDNLPVLKETVKYQSSSSLQSNERKQDQKRISPYPILKHLGLSLCNSVSGNRDKPFSVDNSQQFTSSKEKLCRSEPPVSDSALNPGHNAEPPLHSVTQVSGLKTKRITKDKLRKEEISDVNQHKLDKSQQHTNNLKSLGVGSAVDPDNAAEHPSPSFGFVSGTKIKEPANDGSQTDETIKNISKGQRHCSPVLVSNVNASSKDKFCTTENTVDRMDEFLLPSSIGKCKPSRAKRSKLELKRANVRSPAGYIDEQKEYSFPTSSGEQKASQSTRSKPVPPNLKDQVALSKQKSNRHWKSPLLPFDICQSENQFPTLTEVLLAEDEEQDSERCQLGDGDHPRVLRPGMVLLKGYLMHSEQVSIVRECRHLGLGPGGFYQPGYKDGAKLRLLMMCLGLDWDPQERKYGKRRRVDNSQPPDIPHVFRDMVSKAMIDSQTLTEKEYEAGNVEEILPMMLPDICIVNFYNTTGRLGLHQDRDESRESLAKGLPVVSVSVGDSAEFLYGDERDISKAEKVVLESGDVLIFGGESRHIFHGVESIIPGSAPESLLKKTGLRPGRLNLTFRQF